MAEHLIIKHLEKAKENLYHARRLQDRTLEHVYSEAVRALEKLYRDFIYERSKLEGASVEKSEDDR